MANHKHPQKPQPEITVDRSLRMVLGIFSLFLLRQSYVEGFKEFLRVLVLALMCLSWVVSHRAFAGELSSNSYSQCRDGQLSYELNGSKGVLQTDVPLTIVKGDMVIFHNAKVSCQGSEKLTETIDVVGFAPRRQSTSDAGFIIDSSHDLQSKFAKVSGHDQIFSVIAKIDGIQVNYWKLVVSDPRLDRVEFNVNGQVRVVGNGDELKIKSTDQMKIARIQTNVRGNDHVRHVLKPKAVDLGKDRRQGDLVFLRGDIVMGQIKVIVE